jgi:hypothetical protein
MLMDTLHDFAETDEERLERRMLRGLGRHCRKHLHLGPKVVATLCLGKATRRNTLQVPAARTDFAEVEAYDGPAMVRPDRVKRLPFLRTQSPDQVAHLGKRRMADVILVVKRLEPAVALGNALCRKYVCSRFMSDASRGRS